MATIQHPSLGQLSGLSHEKTEQFLGLKYASLPNRLAAAELHEGPLSSTGYNATHHGPCAPSLPIGCNLEFSLLQQSLTTEQFEFSDLECLSLALTVPKGKLANLPVLVWIHGGGFFIGSSSWPQWDLRRVVELGIDQGMPFIAVGVNYRLGAPGFLTSKDLESLGNRPNNGLRDQQTALRWVQKHISGFGGNPDNVTVIGQSAGGASVTFHLQSSEPLFKRAVAMSGTSLLLTSIPPVAAAEGTYKQVLELLGLIDLPADQAHEQLTSVPFNDFLTKIPPTVPMGPVIDGSIVPNEVTFKSLEADKPPVAGAKWCEALWIGNCSLDGMILAEMALRPRMKGIASAFSASLQKNLPQPNLAHAILDAYKLSNHTDDDAALRAIARFASDAAFDLPAHAWAAAFPGKAHLYRFGEPNPWEGPYKGEATHILDAAFLFQNFNHLLGPKQQELAVAMGRDLVLFVNGKAPVSEAHGVAAQRDGVRVYRATEGTAEGSSREGSSQHGLSELCKKFEVSHDAVLSAWRAFLTEQ